MIGVGIDMVEVERIREALARRPGLLERVFTATERADVAARVDPVPGLAARFAAKEAAMKALGTGFGAVGFRDIEVARDEGGPPVIVLRGGAGRAGAALGVRAAHVSLTHTRTLAEAVVILE